MYSYEDAKLAVIDHFFNVIGNGINTTEDFLNYICIEDSNKSDSEIAALFHMEHNIDSSEYFHNEFNSLLKKNGISEEAINNLENKLKQKDKVNFFPYPNFKKEYSRIYYIDFNRLGEHKESWIKTVQSFYETCIEWFNSEKSLNHFNAYPTNNKDRDNYRLQEMKDYLSKKYKNLEEGNEELYKKIAKDYGIQSFNGDVHQMLCDMWIKNKEQWIKFSKKAIKYLDNI